MCVWRYGGVAVGRMGGRDTLDLVRAGTVSALGFCSTEFTSVRVVLY